MTPALLALAALIAAGAAWLYRRMRREAVVETKVEAAKKVEAAEVAKADAALVEARKQDPIDLVNKHFGSGPKSR